MRQSTLGQIAFVAIVSSPIAETRAKTMGSCYTACNIASRFYTVQKTRESHVTELTTSQCRKNQSIGPWLVLSQKLVAQ